MADRTRWRLILGALLILLASGCGKKSPVEVHGTVTLDGNPVPGATVTFIPMGPPGRPAQGFTSGDGTYTLLTNQEEGVYPGKYRITVVKPLKIGNKEVLYIERPGFMDVNLSAKDKKKEKDKREVLEKEAVKKGGVPAKYGSEGTTPLSRKVPPGGEINLELESGGS